jgi:cytochrome c553
MVPEAVRRCGLAAALFLAGSIAQSQQATPMPTPRLQLCMACHGPQGNSQVPSTPSLAGQPKLFIENQLVLIREGLRDIPQMKGVLDGVPDAEIVEIAGWFAAQKPVPAAGGSVDAAMFKRGQELANRSHCGSCHLPDYAGRQQIPRLAGQHEAFLLQAMKEFRDRPGPGRDTIMAASLYGLKDAELADLAHYLAHFH